MGVVGRADLELDCIVIEEEVATVWILVVADTEVDVRAEDEFTDEEDEMNDEEACISLCSPEIHDYRPQQNFHLFFKFSFYTGDTIPLNTGFSLQGILSLGVVLSQYLRLRGHF